MVMDELIPRSPENSVLGALFIEPRLTGRALQQLNAEDFQNQRARAIFEAIVQLHSQGKNADATLVAGLLQEECPDIGRSIRDCLEETPTASNIWAYADLVREQGRLARLRRCALELGEAGSSREAREILVRAQQCMEQQQGRSRLSTQSLLEDFRSRHEPGKQPEYLSWSMPKLDAGLFTEPGDFVILGGYPSAGKTALALRFAWHMAQSKSVAFYSLETRPGKLADRLLASVAGIHLADIKKNRLGPEAWNRLQTLEQAMAGRRLQFVQASGMTVRDIQSDALEHGYEVIFIDYLQLIATPKATGRVEAVTGISLGLHQLAQSCNITVVALSQLRRPESGRASGPEAAPTMSSLRESGQLEQDADTVMLLYRENPDNPASRRILKIAKNKEGGIGKLYLDFDGATQTFF